MAPDELRRRLERSLACAGPTHRVEDVVAAVRVGQAQWWGNDDAAIVTELLSYPLCRAVNFWLISGELKAALALEPEILAFARAEGCSLAIANGRKGWGHRLAGGGTGWQLHSYNFAKPLIAAEVQHFGRQE